MSEDERLRRAALQRAWEGLQAEVLARSDFAGELRLTVAVTPRGVVYGRVRYNDRVVGALVVGVDHEVHFFAADQ